MTRAVIFAGPSWPHSRPRLPPGVELRPPAESGDLRRAADEGFAHVGLVDGNLVQVLAVTPREVRDVSAQGVGLVGAASLGALRALECPSAMRGVGEVYEALARREIVEEDELVGTSGPNGQPIAVPMVVWRDRLAHAVRDGALVRTASDAVITALGVLPFDERTSAKVASLLRTASPGLDTDAFLGAYSDRFVDIKQRDAMRLLDVVSACVLA